MIANVSAIDFLLAVCGGLLPALIWLLFWLREDAHPEPRGILLATFLGGIMAVFVSLFFEFLLSFYIGGAMLLLSWAAIEETLKLAAAFWYAMRKPSFDEPVDAPIYLITAALGFASVENILFIISSISSRGLLSGFITGNLRFMGATLLHISASAIIGAAIAMCFFHKKHMWRNAIGGLILASLLHFIFNYSIIKLGDENVLKIFIPLWLVTVLILFVFEKVKKINS